MLDLRRGRTGNKPVPYCLCSQERHTKCNTNSHPMTRRSCSLWRRLPPEGQSWPSQSSPCRDTTLPSHQVSNDCYLKVNCIPTASRGTELPAQSNVSAQAGRGRRWKQQEQFLVMTACAKGTLNQPDCRLE